MASHKHRNGYALGSAQELRVHMAAAHTNAVVDDVGWPRLEFLHLEVHEKDRDRELLNRLAAPADHVAVTRKQLIKVLMDAYGEAPEVMAERVWRELQPEPPYQDGRVYVDAIGEYWYRCNPRDLAPGRGVWRNCYSGALAQEGLPRRPLALTGVLPTRDEVEKAVIGHSSVPYLVDRIMALLGRTDGDPDA